MLTACTFLEGTRPGGCRQQPRSPRDAHALADPTHSAELWEFDPLSSVWTEILVNSDVPSAREGHSASVTGSKMVVFGGRGVNSTNGHGGTVLLGEQWEIDLDASRTVVVQSNSSTVRQTSWVSLALCFQSTAENGMLSCKFCGPIYDEALWDDLDEDLLYCCRGTMARQKRHLRLTSCMPHPTSDFSENKCKLTPTPWSMCLSNSTVKHTSDSGTAPRLYSSDASGSSVPGVKIPSLCNRNT